METNTILPPSPFMYQRKERQPVNTKIYIDYKDFPDWNGTKNCLIIGTRGAGKSSVLTAFDYNVRWFNPSQLLRPKKFEQFFPSEPEVVGMFFQCDHVEVSLWEKWRKKTGADNSQAMLLFSTYMNYVFVGMIMQAVFDIMNKYPDKFNEQTSDLFTLITKVLDICFVDLDHAKPSLYSQDMDHLLKHIVGTYKVIRQSVYLWRPIEDIASVFPLHGSAADILKKVCDALVVCLPFFKEKRFFFLLDDVDCFYDWQVMVLNSMIKTAESPYAFKMSSTCDYQTMLSAADGRAISNTELHISRLDGDKDLATERFDAILNIRLSEIPEFSSNDGKYSMNQLFGKHDVENLLEEALKKSIKPEIKELLKEYGESGEKRLTDYWSIRNGLFKKKEPDRKVRDKYRVSSLFSVLSYYSIPESFTYGSSEMIKQITGGSPRNFLKICNAMWEDIYNTLSNKGRDATINIEAQNRAIRYISTVSFDNINKERLDYQTDISRYVMCRRLSDLFGKFMRIDSLKITPECLSLRLDLSSQLEDPKRRLIEIMNNLVMMEVILTRRDKDDNNIWYIALNPMLSPYFVLPYRSPFSYSQSLDPDVFLNLLQYPDERADKIIENIYTSRIKGEQHRLF